MNFFGDLWKGFLEGMAAERMVQGKSPIPFDDDDDDEAREDEVVEYVEVDEQGRMIDDLNDPAVGAMRNYGKSPVVGNVRRVLMTRIYIDVKQVGNVEICADGSYDKPDIEVENRVNEFIERVRRSAAAYAQKYGLRSVEVGLQGMYVDEDDNVL